MLAGQLAVDSRLRQRLGRSLTRERGLRVRQQVDRERHRDVEPGDLRHASAKRRIGLPRRDLRVARRIARASKQAVRRRSARQKTSAVAAEDEPGRQAKPEQFRHECRPRDRLRHHASSITATAKTNSAMTLSLPIALYARPCSPGDTRATGWRYRAPASREQAQAEADRRQFDRVVENSAAKAAAVASRSRRRAEHGDAPKAASSPISAARISHHRRRRGLEDQGDQQAALGPQCRDRIAAGQRGLGLTIQAVAASTMSGASEAAAYRGCSRPCNAAGGSSTNIGCRQRRLEANDVFESSLRRGVAGEHRWR